MENKLKIIPSVLEDVYELAPNLRQEDINELSAFNLTAEDGLLRGFTLSEECFSVKENNKTIGIFGISEFDLPPYFGSIWFLGSKETEKYPITFVKEGRKFVNRFLQKYDILINAVDGRNTKHIEWLRRIGMTITKPININGYEFLQFYKIREKEIKCVM